MENNDFINRAELIADEYYFEALETEDIEEKKELLEEALKVYPDHIDAKQILLFDVYSESMTTFEIIEEAHKIIDQYAPSEEEFSDVYWMSFEYRPYIRMVYRLANFYKEHKLYSTAIELLEPIYKNEEEYGSDGLGIRYLLMTLYVLSYQYDKAVDLYKSLEYSDDMLLVCLLVATILENDAGQAKLYLAELVETNDTFISIFRDKTWPTDAILENKRLASQTYDPWSIQGILIQLYELADLLENDTYVFDWIKNEIKTNPEYSSIFVKLPDNHFSKYEEIREILNYYSHTFIELMNLVLNSDEELPLYLEGESPFAVYLIRQDGQVGRVYSDELQALDLNNTQLASLQDAGINSISELEKLSPTEFLELHGIGIAALEKVRAKGVEFKG